MPNGKSLREINEVQNFKQVKLYRDKYRGKVSIDFIRTLHSLIMNNIDVNSAGAFRRTDDIWIQGCDIRVTPAELIEEELSSAIDRYYERIEVRSIHPFEAAVLFHFDFELVHPFTDGNGRVGREIFHLVTCSKRVVILGYYFSVLIEKNTSILCTSVMKKSTVI